MRRLSSEERRRRRAVAELETAAGIREPRRPVPPGIRYSEPKGADRGPDRARGHLPRVELGDRRQLIRHIAGDIATGAADAAELFDALGVDPRDGKTEC